jgi:hypothetical protein
MPKYVCKGAKLKCSMGDSPSELFVLPDKASFLSSNDIANIMDYKPMVNIKPFGQCKSPANPTVAAATAANLGKLQPMPCIPNTTAPWMNGKTGVNAKGFPVLMSNGKLMCMWAGIIEITDENNTDITGG